MASWRSVETQLHKAFSSLKLLLNCFLHSAVMSPNRRNANNWGGNSSYNVRIVTSCFCRVRPVCIPTASVRPCHSLSVAPPQPQCGSTTGSVWPLQPQFRCTSSPSVAPPKSLRGSAIAPVWPPSFALVWPQYGPSVTPPKALCDPSRAPTVSQRGPTTAPVRHHHSGAMSLSQPKCVTSKAPEWFHSSSSVAAPQLQRNAPS